MSLTLADLDTLYKPVSPLAKAKSLAQVDRHGRAFIALSPFCVIAAAGADGSMDVSPRGGGPGFVRVSEDGGVLMLPDRPGNNRLDTIRNLLSGDGAVGLMFMIPGFDDIYRVNGKASGTDDAALLASFEDFGKPPRLVLVIAVQEAFLHCPKAMMRAQLWDDESRVDRSVMPSLTEMVFDQLGLGVPTMSEEDLRAAALRQL